MEERQLHVLLYIGPGAAGPGIPRLTTILESNHCKITAVKKLPTSRELNIENFDLVLFPGGSATKQFNHIGSEGVQAVREFVESGGGYVGICAGAFLGSVNNSSTVGLTLLDVPYVKKLWKDGEDLRGDIILSLNDTASPWKKADELHTEIECHYHNGAIFPPYHLPKGITVLAAIKEGTGGKAKSAKMRRKATILKGKFGRGHVVLCGPHPEQTVGLEEFTWNMIAAAFPH